MLSTLLLLSSMYKIRFYNQAHITFVKKTVLLNNAKNMENPESLIPASIITVPMENQSGRKI